jgi:hypothetical protein
MLVRGGAHCATIFVYHGGEAAHPPPFPVVTVSRNLRWCLSCRCPRAILNTEETISCVEDFNIVYARSYTICLTHPPDQWQPSRSPNYSCANFCGIGCNTLIFAAK